MTPTSVAPTPLTPTPVAGPPREQPVAGGEEEPAQRQAADAPVPKARLSTCLTLPASIVVSSIVNGTQCQQIGAAGIGIQEIIDAGFIDAVDLWGYLGPGVQVCFRGSGPLFFLDAANMPRSPEPMPAYSLDGMTCGIVSRPGSVVLVPGPAPAPLPPAAQELSGCMVTTTDILNFRASPNGSVMSQLPFNVTLTALSRTENWFEVDYHGESGWISADYVITEGACG